MKMTTFPRESNLDMKEKVG
jgi:hypothetical protein